MERDPWQVAGSAAEIYQQRLVPAIFGPWAPQLLDLVGVRLGERVLDVACGTGVVARLAAERAGPEGWVVGLDLNSGMLAVAASLPVVGAPVEWRQASAEQLPFPDHSFDVVCCQLGLQFFADRVAALREMSRVLVRDGRVAILVWRPIEYSPGFEVLAQALDRHVGTAAAAIMRAPFALGAEGQLRGMAQEAGFTQMRVHQASGAVHFASAQDLVTAYGTGSPLAGPIEALDDLARERLVTTVETALKRWQTEDGLSFPIQALLLSAVAGSD